jgi:predicted  nucleic acid-binding Zn-ribbon protein
MDTHNCIQEDHIKDIRTKIDVIMSRMTDVKELKVKEDELLKKENEYMHQLLDDKFLVLSEKLEANHSVIFAQNQEMIAHQKITNGRVNKTEGQIESISRKLEEIRPQIDEVREYSRMMIWIKEHPVKAASFIFIVLLCMSEIVELIDITNLLKFIK